MREQASINAPNSIVISGPFAVGCAALLLGYIFYCVLHATDTPQSAADAEADDDDGSNLLAMIGIVAATAASIAAGAAMACAFKKLKSTLGKRKERQHRDHHDRQRELVYEKKQQEYDEASRACKEKREMMEQEEKKKIDLPELCSGIGNIGLTEEYPHNLKMDDEVDDGNDAPGLVNSSFALDDDEEDGGEDGGEGGTAVDGQAMGCIIL